MAQGNRKNIFFNISIQDIHIKLSIGIACGIGRQLPIVFSAFSVIWNNCISQISELFSESKPGSELVDTREEPLLLFFVFPLSMGILPFYLGWILRLHWCWLH